MDSIVPQKTSARLVEITAAEHNQRLDNFLFKQLDRVPRTRIYRIIRKGEVRVNKKRCKPEYKLQTGDLVRIPPLRIEAGGTGRQALPAGLSKLIAEAILYESEHILILDKPGGIAVHAGSGVDYGIIDLLRRQRPDDEIELVHRLDRDTSGCLLLAKHRQALLAMQASLQDKSLVKRYCALVKGRWPENLQRIEHRLQKYRLPNGERRMRVDGNGKTALTRVHVLQAGELFSRIQLELVTGRTHQIRIHCQAEGHEIAGDEKYGDREFNRLMRKRKIDRLMLHAASLELPASDYTPEIVINAPLPDEFNLSTNLRD